MKFLLIGCGSIGRRHLGNFHSLGVKDFILCDTNEDRLDKVATEFGISHRYGDYMKAIAEQTGIAAAVIATPSSLHVPIATECAKKGIHLFIEKPLSHTLDGVAELNRLVKEKNLVAMMAMCYRFHPVFLRLKELTKSQSLGKIYHVNYFGGHYLPDWHPQEDYRKEYAARKEMGGGYVLTSIHGFDNIRWLFGEPSEVASFVDRVGELDIDVDDIAVSVMRIDRGPYVSISGDFLQRTAQHRMVVAGELGTARCDFNTGAIDIYKAGTSGWKEEKVSFSSNDMYEAEARDFLSCLTGGKKPEADMEDGARNLRLALAVKESSEKRKFVRI